MNVFGDPFFRDEFRLEGEVGYSTIFGAIKVTSRTQKTWGLTAHPLKREYVLEVARESARNLEHHPAPTGYIPYGAFFRASALAVAGDIGFRKARHLTASDVDHLRRATAMSVLRNLMEGELSLCVGYSTKTGLEDLDRKVWQVDGAAQLVEYGGMRLEGKLCRFVLADPTATANKRGGVRKVEPSARTAAYHYFALYPSGCQREDPPITWGEATASVADITGQRDLKTGALRTASGWSEKNPQQAIDLWLEAKLINSADEAPPYILRLSSESG
ncbi:hypothetical protein [Jannaschia sp. CCS1]|uniref:hypothetical protein n=1 Tax=Jannaschia sp. (strain CCS1) TaxID=290400 RepID=UPI000053C3FE|nr:hypothetical protein [Jannaschia sp. CCS1]ABD53147.1 hypothetical protein Jann_0230 [Jannaschia sp. CCS1]